jgi:lantibiotic transport system permease protein
MTFLASLQSEFLKTKRTRTVLLSLLIAAATPFIILIDFSNEESAPGSNPWFGLLLHDGIQGTTILVLPLYIILLCTMLPQIEYRNNTWKQVLASPQQRLHVFGAKFLNLQLFIILFLLFYQFLTISIALPLEMMHPHVQFSKFPLPWAEVLLVTVKIYVAALGMSSLLFWIGIRFKNFAIPIGIGLSLWALTMALFEMKVPHREKFPFALPPMMIFEKFADQVPMLLVYSLGYMIVFLSIAFLDFKRLRMR